MIPVMVSSNMNRRQMRIQHKAAVVEEPLSYIKVNIIAVMRWGRWTPHLHKTHVLLLRTIEQKSKKQKISENGHI